MVDVRKVIDTEVYDTETADRIYTIADDVGEISLDGNVDRTALYRTKKGRWFIAGESGANGRWRKRGQNNRYEAGEGLELLTPEQADKYLDEMAALDVIEG